MTFEFIPKQKQDSKPHFDKRQSRSKTPPRVAARMEGKVKNAGIKTMRKAPAGGKKGGR